MSVSNSTFAKGITGLMVILLVVALAWPVQNSKRKAADQKRSELVSQLSYEIDSYYSLNNQLPQMLSDVELSGELEEEANAGVFEYNKLLRRQYEICTEFKTDTSETVSNAASLYGFDSSYYPPDDNSDPYTHEAGRVCFEFEAYGYGYEPYPLSDDVFEGFDSSDLDLFDGTSDLEIFSQ